MWPLHKHHVATTTKLFNGLIVEPPHSAAVVLYCAVTSQHNNKSSLINKTNRNDAPLCSAALIAFQSTLNPCTPELLSLSIDTWEAEYSGYFLPDL
jgi:hypothetical protein